MNKTDHEPTRLLLLTRYYPFHHGEVAAEAYLETEIPYLASCFDEILVVGTEAAPGSVVTCELSANVTPLALGCGNSTADKVRYIAKGLWYGITCPQKVSEVLASEPVTQAIKVAFRGYFAARAYAKWIALRNQLIQLEFEPTHVYSFWLYDTALVGVWLAREYHCKRVLARTHRYDLYEECSRVHYLPFRPYLLTNLDAVVPCSKDGHRYINERWPGFEDRLYTNYLGTRTLSDQSEELAGDTFRIVSCSQVVPVKRVQRLAEAMAILDTRGAGIQWTHYGDGPWLSNVKELCKKFASVKAEFPGYLPNAALLRAYATCHIDLFVNVSASEGLPISIMEASGCGIPVLATDVGGTHEIVTDGINGWLIPENADARYIADTVEQIMRIDKERMLSMRRAARSTWESHFRIERNVHQLVQMFGIGDIDDEDDQGLG